jgi:hypothetical protein
MLQAFVFNEVAIVVRHWYEVCKEDEEHGARIEVVRRVGRPHHGSPSSSQVIELDNRLIWRADLFDLIGEEPGNMKRAHHHIRFKNDGSAPLRREWDDDLREDPFGWTETRLSDLNALAAASGAELVEIEADAEDIRRNLPAIMSAVRNCAPERCVSIEHCRQQTRDTNEIVQMKVNRVREDRRDPRLIELDRQSKPGHDLSRSPS